MATINLTQPTQQQVQLRQITGTFGVFVSRKGNLSLVAEGRFYNSGLPIGEFLKQCGLSGDTDVRTIQFKGTITYVNRNVGTQEEPQWRAFIRQLDGEIVPAPTKQ